MTEMNLSRCPIGVFDSGLGGLTAFRELRRLLPNEDIIYFGDTGRVPYGTKSRETILNYAKQDVDFLLGQKVKMVIAACGTVSANVPEDFADSLPVPFTGVVQHTCAAAVKTTKTGHIGIIATPATIRSKAYETYIHRISPETRVTALHCSLFVPLVENGFIQSDNPVTRLVAEQYLAPFFGTDVDTLILGCTHYPLISEAVLSVLGREVPLVDSGGSCVGSVLDALAERDALAQPGRIRTEAYFCSARRADFTRVAQRFLGRSIDALTKEIDVEGY